MPCGYSRLTSQGTRAQQAQDPAGSWHNLGKPDYPRHDEPVDPGTDELANHKDIFPFIIPGKNRTTLFINSPDITERKEQTKPQPTSQKTTKKCTRKFTGVLEMVSRDSLFSFLYKNQWPPNKASRRKIVLHANGSKPVHSSPKE